MKLTTGSLALPSRGQGHEDHPDGEGQGGVHQTRLRSVDRLQEVRERSTRPGPR